MNRYLLTAILTSLLFTGTAFAVPESKELEPRQPDLTTETLTPPHNPEMERHKNEFNRRLNLTDEQKYKAKQLRVNSQEKMKPLMDELIVKQQQRNMLENNDGNDKEIQTLNNDIKYLRQKLHNIILQNERDFMEILTPEQKNEFNKMREERKQILNQKRMMKKHTNPYK